MLACGPPVALGKGGRKGVFVGTAKADFNNLVGAPERFGESPLAYNGGPTETIALLTKSPAINKASPKTSRKRDQRGHKRDPNHPDIGAYEAAG